MSLPYWISLPDLGSFQQDHSFDLYPVQLDFSAAVGSTISLLNGALPPGLSFYIAGSSVLIKGVIDASLDQDTIFNFTLRISQKTGGIADRTFAITVRPLATVASWAGQPLFLGYQQDGQTVTYQLRATAPDGMHVIYSLVSPPAGMSIDRRTGLLTFSPTIGHAALVSATVNAALGTTPSYITVSIQVETASIGPQWITPVGSSARRLNSTKSPP